MKPAISVILQNRDKVLTIRDVTIPTVSEGWGVDWEFDDFFDANQIGINDTEITINIVIETKDITYTKTLLRSDFTNMASIDNENISEQADIYYNIGMINGELIALSYNDSISLIDLQELPDGIYSIEYIITDLFEEENKLDEMYVLTNKADEVLVKKSNEIQDKLFVCPYFDIEDAFDYLTYEAMHTSLTTASKVSQRDTIINTLDHINNEDYEYYKD